MNFDEYQINADKTAIYPRDNDQIRIVYPALGLNGEAGECAEIIKKWIRLGGDFPIEAREKLFKELGDVLWYASQICTEFGFSMSEVAATNIAKLQDRKDRNVLQGSGDNR